MIVIDVDRAPIAIGPFAKQRLAQEWGEQNLSQLHGGRIKWRIRLLPFFWHDKPLIDPCGDGSGVTPFLKQEIGPIFVRSLLGIEK